MPRPATRPSPGPTRSRRPPPTAAEQQEPVPSPEKQTYPTNSPQRRPGAGESARGLQASRRNGIAHHRKHHPAQAYMSWLISHRRRHQYQRTRSNCGQAEITRPGHTSPNTTTHQHRRGHPQCHPEQRKPIPSAAANTAPERRQLPNITADRQHEEQRRHRGRRAFNAAVATCSEAIARPSSAFALHGRGSEPTGDQSGLLEWHRYQREQGLPRSSIHNKTGDVMVRCPPTTDSTPGHVTAWHAKNNLIQPGPSKPSTSQRRPAQILTIKGDSPVQTSPQTSVEE